MIRTGETICAPATSGGGAITVIRISGPETISISEKIFSPNNKDLSISSLPGYTVVYGDIIDGSEIVDDVLLTLFRSPHSYTGEDSVEISCHASPYIQRRILELLVKNGAKSAFPGEFTQRAFINGKMDLSQAEAVADVIASSSEASHRIASNQMRGGISTEIKKLRADLLHFASLIELELDFGEEDVEFADRKELKGLILKVRSVSDNLASSFKVGNAIKNGIPVAIVGKPNSGKSTLLNALLMEEKAIVSEIPGTTRDVIEDSIFIDGIEYRFIDTAGLRDTSDIIENLGIKKTHDKIDQASVIMLIDEANDSVDDIKIRINNIRQIIGDPDKKLMIILNKSDLSGDDHMDDLRNNIELKNGEELIFISAKNRTGLEIIQRKLGEVVDKERLSSDSVIINNIRHYDALMNISGSLERVIEGLENNLSEDLIAIDIRQAIHYLGEITGEITSDEILGNIFRNFCIGK
jgi:tRNA modification GTPase